VTLVNVGWRRIVRFVADLSPVMCGIDWWASVEAHFVCMPRAEDPYCFPRPRGRTLAPTFPYMWMEGGMRAEGLTSP
jgi:hypothetical protein